MAFFLDSTQYQSYRRPRILAALLARAYFDGNPYGLQDGTDNAWLRYLVLQDPEDLSQNEAGKYSLAGPGYPYVYNIARERIRHIVGALLPDSARLIVEGVEEEQRDALFSALFGFGAKFSRTENGFMDWARTLLTMMAIGGDCLVLPRLVPLAGGFTIRYNVYDNPCWDAEMDPDNSGEVLFYRVEEKLWEGDRLVWRRFDIYADRIIRYVTETVGVDKPPWQRAFPGLENMLHQSNVDPWLFAGTMEVAGSSDPVEQALLAKLKANPAQPVVYGTTTTAGVRGEPELLLPDLRAIDASNKLMFGWREAVMQTNFPPLSFIDAVAPKDESGKEISYDITAGAVNNVKSEPDKNARVAYPDNLPTEFAFPDPFEQVARAAFGPVPTPGLKSDGVQRLAELSGFAHGMINAPLRQTVSEIRARAIDGAIIPLLETGIKMLALQGALPDGVAPSQIKFKLNYGGELLTEDEKLKRTLVIGGLIDRGVPPAQLAPHIPLDVEDSEAVAQGMEKQRQETADLMEFAAKAKTAPAAGGSPRPADSAGVDKRAR